MLDQKRHQMITLAPLDGATIMIEGPPHPRHRDPLQGCAQGLGDLLAEGHQNGGEEPRCLALQLHGIA